MIKKLSSAVGVALIALIAVILIATFFSDGSEETNPLVGETAPVIRGVSLDGQNIDTAEYTNSDKWVVVNFFALWCPECIVEHPELIEIERWGKETGQLEVVSVVYGVNDFSAVEEFFVNNQVVDSQGEVYGVWPVLDSPNTGNEFLVKKVPETFLIAPNGEVANHILGGVKAEDLIDFIGSQS